MAEINRVPRGFLGLLDSKTGGQTPREIDSKVQGVIDLTTLYAADLTLEATAVLGSASSGDIGTLVNLVTVPAGELWLVQSVAGALVVPATGGLGFEFEMAVDANTGIGAHWLTSEAQTFSGLSQFEQVVRSVVFTPLTVFGPGTSFGIWPTRLFPASSAVTTSVLHYRVIV